MEPCGQEGRHRHQLNSAPVIRRTAVVTGAARGIGLACAMRLLDQGHAVALVDTDTSALGMLADLIPADRVLLIEQNITAPDAAQRIEAAISGCGWEEVGILVNNAGVSPKHEGRAANLLEMSLSEWNSVLDVNLTAAMLLCKQFLPAMRRRRWGRIVNISSSAGRTAAVIAGPAYMASKAALLGLTRHIASHFAKDGVTANAIAPGRIGTDMAAASAGVGGGRYLAGNPSGREGRTEEVAGAVAFLCSDDAGYCNGAVIDVNGGSFMN
ncbi:MAG: SDR family NAD(P)-dependent oxidoreductase [Burkholderiaceae bacterium]|nr:SDR family NAD(P)-dependent oxidoreductase [Burkholderiaceae bacterium]